MASEFFTGNELNGSSSLQVEFTWICGARNSATFRHSSLASHFPQSQGNSRPKPRLARCREAAAVTSPGIGATPPARNEWPIITPSAEDKPVEFHL